jgi:hypothetical protein
MNDTYCLPDALQSGSDNPENESGFSLVEFIVSAAILLAISITIFEVLNDIQRTAGYQADVQAVLDNTRIAIQTVERCIRQAGNDPYRKGFDAISIIGPAEVGIRSDLTGSAGPGNPNKGDPDGDTNDSGENLAIRYNDRQQRLELIPMHGPAQIIAENISGLSLKYFDADGNATGIGRNVRKITVTASGSGRLKDPWTGRQFEVQLDSVIRISS